MLAFIVASFAALISTAAASLLSPKPTHWHHHAMALGRLGIFASVAFQLAQLLEVAYQPSLFEILLLVSLVLVYGTRSLYEIQRQRNTGG